MKILVGRCNVLYLTAHMIFHVSIRHTVSTGVSICMGLLITLDFIIKNLGTKNLYHILQDI